MTEQNTYFLQWVQCQILVVEAPLFHGERTLLVCGFPRASGREHSSSRRSSITSRERTEQPAQLGANGPPSFSRPHLPPTLIRVFTPPYYCFAIVLLLRGGLVSRRKKAFVSIVRQTLVVVASASQPAHLTRDQQARRAYSRDDSDSEF